VDQRKSLEQLDGEDWGDPPTGASGLVADVHHLRRIPIAELTDGDLRTLLGQRVGAEWLIAVALARLDRDPMAGDWYPGDLLRAVLHAGSDHWASHPDEQMQLWAVRESLERLGADVSKTIDDENWPAFR
jgi:hypothetical protein